MKLNEILSDSFNAAEWEAKGYELPKYHIAAVAKKTHDEPTWVHFGAGNIFRAFPAAILIGLIRPRISISQTHPEKKNIILYCGLCLRLPPHSCIIKMLSMETSFQKFRI